MNRFHSDFDSLQEIVYKTINKEKEIETQQIEKYIFETLAPLFTQDIIGLMDKTILKIKKPANAEKLMEYYSKMH